MYERTPLEDMKEGRTTKEREDNKREIRIAFFRARFTKDLRKIIYLLFDRHLRLIN